MANQLEVAKVNSILLLHQRGWSSRPARKSPGRNGGTTMSAHSATPFSPPGFAFQIDDDEIGAREQHLTKMEITVETGC